MANTRWSVPRHIEVVLHIGIVRKQFAIAIERSVEDIAKPAGIRFKVLAVWINFVNDSARRKSSAIVASPVRHAWQQMIFAPDLRNLRCFRQFCWDGVVARDQEQRLTVGARHHRVDSVISLRLHLPQHFNFVELIVSVAVGNPIQTRWNLFFVIVDGDIQGIESPHHPIDRANARRHALHVGGTESFSGGRRPDSVQPAELVADQ